MCEPEWFKAERSRIQERFVPSKFALTDTGLGRVVFFLAFLFYLASASRQEWLTCCVGFAEWERVVLLEKRG